MNNENNNLTVTAGILPELGREKVLIVKRHHWFILAARIVATMFVYIVAVAASIAGFIFMTTNLLLLASINIVLFLLASSTLLKIIVDWYCNFYVVTTRRVLELSHKPLFSDRLNNVILNQVKSTEIDVNTNGIINKLLDMGDVTLTFDRPTHHDEFTFSNIENPKAVGLLLCEALDVAKEDREYSPIWYNYYYKQHKEHMEGDILGEIL